MTTQTIPQTADFDEWEDWTAIVNAPAEPTTVQDACWLPVEPKRLLITFQPCGDFVLMLDLPDGFDSPEALIGKPLACGGYLCTGEIVR